MTVSVEEAKQKLEELLQKALAGETVEIAAGTRKVRLEAVKAVQPIAVRQEDRFVRFHTPQKGPRPLGTAAGQIWIAEDFDTPLDDFEAYM